MFDVVYLLVGVVCCEAAVMALGLFWYLPKAISKAFQDAEAMIVRQRDATLEAAGDFLEDLLTAENVAKLAAVAAPVLGEHLKKSAAGIIGARVRRASGGGDLLGDIGSAIISRFIGGAVPQEMMGGEGVPPPPTPPPR